jgi:transmembrane sensor
MSNLLERVEEARERVAPRWTALRERKGLERFEHSVRRGGRRWLWILALPAVLVAAVLFARVERTSKQALVPGRAEPTSVARTLPSQGLSDGSRVISERSDARYRVTEQGPTRTTVRLDAGAARFVVTPNRTRVFAVVAGPVEVTVLGTEFVVTVSSERVLVAVDRGRVRVKHPGGEAFLGAGEHGSFETQKFVASSGAEASKPEAAAPSARAADAAFPKVAGAEELLRAADAARAAGDWGRARTLFERILAEHPRDSRTSLAAFSLGKLLLEQLGDARSAARYFAQARSLAPGGSLAEDALAREVEALSRAGAKHEARLAAREYFERYPNGRRRALVERAAQP